MSVVQLIGIDCAAADMRTGLARGEVTPTGVEVRDVVTKSADVASVVVEWLSTGWPTLIAMDSPLGWPTPLADLLDVHRAGGPVGLESDQLFRRLTDRAAHAHLDGRPPLEVGADRIARVAAHSLRLLNAIRAKTRLELPLNWTPGKLDDSSVIEVYPRATLWPRFSIRSRFESSNKLSYKSDDEKGRKHRQDIVFALVNEVDAGPWEEVLIEDDDALDAVVCLLGAHDFLHRRLVLPPRDSRVFREGWIWYPDLSDSGGGI